MKREYSLIIRRLIHNYTDLICWPCKKYFIIIQTSIWSKKCVYYFKNKYNKTVTVTEFVDGNRVFEFVRIKEF